MTPFEGKNRVTSLYGWRTLNGVRQWHAGLDVVGDTNKNVRAVWDTIRTEYVKSYNGGRGYTAYLYYSKTLRVLCQHLASFSAAILAKKAVKQGDVIGVMGNTGDSYGAHLHIEVQVYTGGRWTAVAPMQYVELTNTIGTQQGNNHKDNAASTGGPQPSSGYVTLCVGPMTTGDKDTFKGMADALAIGYKEAFVDKGRTTLYLGPVSSGDRNAIEAKAKSLSLPVSELVAANVTLVIGPQSNGDRDTMDKLARSLGLPVRADKDASRDIYTQYIGPMSPGDRKTIENKAASLMLPVAVV